MEAQNPTGELCPLNDRIGLSNDIGCARDGDTTAMNRLPLTIQKGHLFVGIAGEQWLIDTGAPVSFGGSAGLSIGEERFQLGAGHRGITPAKLTEFIGVPCAGLLGGDVLNRFDHIFDLIDGQLTLSTNEAAHDGAAVPLDDCLGIPIVTARIGGRDFRMFFDTGAQISYLEPELLAGFPSLGDFVDFYPSHGRFTTQTHHVPLSLAGISFQLRCGSLPKMLSAAMSIAGTRGIVGNAVVCGRRVGYFPRRRLLVL